MGFDLGAKTYGQQSMDKSDVLLYNQSKEGEVKRTIALVAALLCGTPILSLEYLVDSHKAGNFLPRDEYAIMDARVTGRNCNPFSLNEAIENGKNALQLGGFLQGRFVYVNNDSIGPKIGGMPDMKQLSLLIKFAGASRVSKKAIAGHDASKVVIVDNQPLSSKLQAIFGMGASTATPAVFLEALTMSSADLLITPAAQTKAAGPNDEAHCSFGSPKKSTTSVSKNLSPSLSSFKIGLKGMPNRSNTRRGQARSPPPSLMTNSKAEETIKSKGFHISVTRGNDEGKKGVYFDRQEDMKHQPTHKSHRKSQRTSCLNPVPVFRPNPQSKPPVHQGNSQAKPKLQPEAEAEPEVASKGEPGMVQQQVKRQVKQEADKVPVNGTPTEESRIEFIQRGTSEFTLASFKDPVRVSRTISNKTIAGYDDREHVGTGKLTITQKESKNKEGSWAVERWVKLVGVHGRAEFLAKVPSVAHDEMQNIICVSRAGHLGFDWDAYDKARDAEEYDYRCYTFLFKCQGQMRAVLLHIFGGSNWEMVDEFMAPFSRFNKHRSKPGHALIGDENGMSDGEDQLLPTRIRQEIDEYDSDNVNLMTQDW